MMVFSFLTIIYHLESLSICKEWYIMFQTFTFLIDVLSLCKVSVKVMVSLLTQIKDLDFDVNLFQLESHVQLCLSYAWSSYSYGFGYGNLISIFTIWCW